MKGKPRGVTWGEAAVVLGFFIAIAVLPELLKRLGQ